MNLTLGKANDVENFRDSGSHASSFALTSGPGNYLESTNPGYLLTILRRFASENVVGHFHRGDHVLNSSRLKS